MLLLTVRQRKWRRCRIFSNAANMILFLSLPTFHVAHVFVWNLRNAAVFVGSTHTLGVGIQSHTDKNYM